MTASPQPIAKEAPPAERLKPRVRQSRPPDFSTLAGLAVAISGILGGFILEKGNIQDVAQATAAMIVLGGTLGAVMVTTPMPLMRRAFRALGGIFRESPTTTGKTIDALIHYATRARKNGIVSLEDEAAEIPDPFLRKALNLAVDGTDLQELRQMMELDIALGEQAAEAEARVWESAGGYSPTIGIIGAVLGLIQVMKHLEDINQVGHGIAVAFVATIYGVGAANVFFLPAANKLRARMREATILREMTLEGVAAIVEGMNPTLIRLKLEPYQQQSRKARKYNPVVPEREETPPRTGAAGG